MITVIQYFIVAFLISALFQYAAARSLSPFFRRRVRCEVKNSFQVYYLGDRVQDRHGIRECRLLPNSMTLAAMTYTHCVYDPSYGPMEHHQEIQLGEWYLKCDVTKPDKWGANSVRTSWTACSNERGERVEPGLENKWLDSTGLFYRACEIVPNGKENKIRTKLVGCENNGKFVKIGGQFLDNNMEFWMECTSRFPGTLGVQRVYCNDKENGNRRIGKGGEWDETDDGWHYVCDSFYGKLIRRKDRQSHTIDDNNDDHQQQGQQGQHPFQQYNDDDYW